MADFDRLIQAIDAAEQSSYGSESDSDLQTDRAIAIDLYHGQNIQPAPEGRSQMIDRTVFETIQWMLPSLSRIFANGDDIVEFQPFGPEDELAAKQESDYLNFIVTQKNPWPLIFNTWAMDALICKNGYCEPYMEEKLHTELETYERQSDEALAFLLQDEGVEIVSHSPEPDPSQMVPRVDPATGQPAVDPMTGQPLMQPRVLHTVTIRKTTPTKKLCFKVIPPERTKVDIDTDSFLLENCNYFEYWDIVPISELRAVGFDVDDDIASGGEDSDETEEGNSRDLYSEETMDLNSGATDPSMRKVKFRTIWIRHDTDEDGIAEMQKVYRVGEEILDRGGKPAIYPCTRVGVACITPNLNPHRHVGTSEVDITADIQMTRTAMIRGGLDGFYLSVNPRHVVSNEVNLDDMMVNRPGGITRMNEGSTAVPGEGHVFPIETKNTLPDAIAGLEYMGIVHEGRTGVSRAFAGVDPNTLNKGSSGVAINQLSTMASQRIEQIARLFAIGVQYLFSCAHELIIKSGHKAEVVKLRGNWVTIDPSAWKNGRDMRISVGYGAGNKDSLVARLMLIKQAQVEAMQMGLRVANEKNLYETNVELTKASDFSAPQRFWTDPTNLPPPPPPQPTPDTLVAAEVEKLKVMAGEKSKAAEILSSERVKQAEIESDERIKNAELSQEERIAQFEAEVKVMLEKLKLGGTAELETLKSSLKSDADAKGELNKQVGQGVIDKIGGIEKAMAAAAKAGEDLRNAMNAPREVIRGKDGRVAGVKVGGVERKVKRDPDGRVSGLQ